MKRFFLLLFIFLTTHDAFSQKIKGSQVVDMMYNRYAGKWHKTMGVVKDVESFEKGKAKPAGSWLVAIEYPGKFRMDIGDPASKTTILLNNKMLYKWQDGKKIYENTDRSSLVFLNGGMYFYKRQDLRLKFLSYDINVDNVYQTTFNGQPVYVLGPTGPKGKVTQIWIDKEKLILLRLIEFDGAGTEIETRYEGHQKQGNSWVETKVSHLENGKVLQVEKYKGKVLTNIKFDPLLFDPVRLYQARHWYYNKVIK